MSVFQHSISNIPNITLLTYGESDLPPDSNIKSETIRALLLDNNKYSNPQGNLSLRKLIAFKENQKHHQAYNEENILITNGSTEALFLSLSALINPGDEILLVIPTYPSYEMVVSYLGGKVTYVKCNNDFEIDITDLKKKINDKIKAIILNYPNNPTGSILSNDTIKELKHILLKYQTPIILDNVYDEILFIKNMDSLNDYIELKPQRIIINSLSKSQRLTGWRLGYLIGPKELISLCTKLHQEINICLPSFLMEGMKFALSCSPEINYYKQNLKYTINQLKKMHLNYYIPKGGYYICFSIKEFKITSYDFCKFLAKNYKVGLMPGSFFLIDDYVRLCIAVSPEKLSIGLKKLKKGIKKIKEKYL